MQIPVLLFIYVYTRVLLCCAIVKGDPKQLGPIITCRLAAEYGLATSLLERAMAEAPYLRQDGEVSLVTC